MCMRSPGEKGPSGTGLIEETGSDRYKTFVTDADIKELKIWIAGNIG